MYFVFNNSVESIKSENKMVFPHFAFALDLPPSNTHTHIYIFRSVLLWSIRYDNSSFVKSALICFFENKIFKMNIWWRHKYIFSVSRSLSLSQMQISCTSGYPLLRIEVSECGTKSACPKIFIATYLSSQRSYFVQSTIYWVSII